MNYLVKDPDSVVAFHLDWQQHRPDEVGLATIDIVASSWSVSPVEPGGLIIQTAELAGTVATVTLRGGRVGALYDATHRVTLINGEQDERSLAIRVEPR